MSRVLGLVAFASVVMGTTGRPVHAHSLAGKLHRFIDTKGFPTFGDFIEVVTPIVQRLALRGIDFPVIATAPAFTYRFNLELGVPERSSESLGPVFVERADTVGERRIDVGFSYLYADLTRFDGHDFGRQILTAGVRTDPRTGAQVGGAFLGDDFSLASHVLSLSGTYGLTDRWDVNALVPVVSTTLRLGGTAGAVLVVGTHDFSALEHVRFDESAVGIGDVLLRSKYRFADVADLNLATSLTLRLPTGNERNFQGIGDTTVFPALIASRTFGTHDVHGTLGIEANADDLERTRARYAVGTSLQPCEWLALLVDLLGSSSFVDDEFAISAPTGRVFHGGRDTQLFGREDLIRSIGRTRVIAFVPRSDVVDLAAGLRVAVAGNAVAFASAIVPLTNDGLRAEVMPTAGVEVSF